MIGEVGPLIAQSGSTNGDGLHCTGRRVRASIPVVVTSSNSKVHARLDSPVDSIIQSERFSATQRHIGDGTLVPRLSCGSVLGFSSGKFIGCLVSSPEDTTDNISHCTTSAGTQNLDGDEVCSLGNTILARTDGTGTVSPMTVSILVDIILRNCLAPGSASLELEVVNIDTSVDHVHIDPFTARRIVLVQSESSKSKPLAVRDARKTLKGGKIVGHATKLRLKGTYPWSVALSIQCVNNGVLFNISNLRHLSDTLNDGVGETTGVALEVTVVDLADTNGSLGKERVILVSSLEEVEMVVHGGRMEVILQHDNVRVVENLFGVHSLEGMEGGESERRPQPGNVMGGRQRSGYDGGDEEGKTQSGQHGLRGRSNCSEPSTACPRNIPFQTKLMFVFVCSLWLIPPTLIINSSPRVYQLPSHPRVLHLTLEFTHIY